MRPGFGGDELRGMRRVFEGIIRRRYPTRLDGLDFAVNRHHGIAEPVQLGFRFALGRLDHECARHGPRNRRRVKPVIHEALGDIFDGHQLERAQIQDAFVSYESVSTAIQHGVIRSQPGGDVIGVQDRHPRGLGQTVRAHRRDVHPRDRQNPRAAPGSAGHRATF